MTDELSEDQIVQLTAAWNANREPAATRVWIELGRYVPEMNGAMAFWTYPRIVLDRASPDLVTRLNIPIATQTQDVQRLYKYLFDTLTLTQEQVDENSAEGKYDT